MSSVLNPLVVAQGHIVTVTSEGARRRARQLPEGWTLAEVAALAIMAVQSDPRGALFDERTATVYLFDDAGHRPDLPLGQVGPAAGWVSTATSGTHDGEPWRWRLTSRATRFARAESGRNGAGPAAEVSVVSVPRDMSRQAGPWGNLSPGEALDSFATFNRLAGLPWADGIGRTAERLILASHPLRKGGTRLDQSPVIPGPADDNTLETAWMSWARPLLESEQRMGQTVHVFDASAQYLAAWGVVELGHGQPALHRLPVFDPRQVGIWRVSNLEDLRNPMPTLPAPWLPGREWMTTPTLARTIEALDGHAQPELAEAWIWPHHSRWLRAASERIRDARSQAQQLATPRPEHEVKRMSDAQLATYLAGLVSGSAVLDALKSLYTIQTGRLGMSARDARSGWHRPDWANLIRAQARANLHRRLGRLTAHPMAIATDALVFVADEPDPIKFASRIGLPIGPALGQYTHEGSAPRQVLDQVLDQARPGRSPANVLVGAVKAHQLGVPL